MSRIAVVAACGFVLGLSLPVARADAPPVATFAAAPRISDASVSTDGRYLAMIAALGKGQSVVVQDRATPGARPRAVLSASDGFQLLWCRWPGPAHLVCALHTPVMVGKNFVQQTRLVGMDADGGNVKVLLQEQDVPGAPIIDTILAWDVAGSPNAVLLAMQPLQEQKVLSDTRAQHQDDKVLPSVYEMNTVTGDMKVRVPAHDPVRNFLLDAKGEARLGWGPNDRSETEYAVRDPVSKDWRKLGTLSLGMRPVAMCAAGLDCAYAVGPSPEGRTALWRLDLTGKNPPSQQFAHPSVDLDAPLLARDGHLFGVRYDADQPMVYWTDQAAANIVGNLRKLMPGAFVQISNYTSDGRQMIIESSSDVDAGSFFLFDVEKNTIARVGTGYPDLDAAKIGHMQLVNYPAQDGASVPAFLTTPAGTGKSLPLVMLPHGGQSAHERWQFHLLRAFLVSRGYAVLQVNYRGSSGYGLKWQSDAHGDWSGLTYSDVADGARWAVRQGIADARRVCIMGSDYAGYVALLAAERNADVFRCAISVGGFSDLGLNPPLFFMPGMPPKSYYDKLHADSPRQHAADAQVPILLIHGDRDTVTDVEQSRVMDAALTDAHKPHQFVQVAGGGHDFDLEADRTTAFTAIESFLAANIGVAATGTAAISK